MINTVPMPKKIFFLILIAVCHQTNGRSLITYEGVQKHPALKRIFSFRNFSLSYGLGYSKFLSKQMNFGSTASLSFPNFKEEFYYFKPKPTLYDETAIWYSAPVFKKIFYLSLGLDHSVFVARYFRSSQSYTIPLSDSLQSHFVYNDRFSFPIGFTFHLRNKFTFSFSYFAPLYGKKTHKFNLIDGQTLVYTESSEREFLPLQKLYLLRGGYQISIGNITLEPAVDFQLKPGFSDSLLFTLIIKLTEKKGYFYF